jgi:TonB family protein
MKRSYLALAIVLLAPSLTHSARAQEVAPETASHSITLSVDILSDTMGADLAPYMRTTLSAIKNQWQPLVEQAGQQHLHTPDETVISLTIAPDGHVSAMKLVHSTGNAMLDKAAWTAMTSAHYGPLPAELKDAPLKMRIHFPAH